MTRKQYRPSQKRRQPAKVREAAPVLLVPGAVYTLQEACRALRISEATARRWIKAGRLSARKIGRDYRLLGSELEEAVRRRDEDAGAVLAPDHPFWALAGIGNSGGTDIARHKHEHVADAYYGHTHGDT